jgi:hypothetical protein
MQARHCLTYGVAKLARNSRVRLGKRFNARARIARNDRTVDDRLYSEVMFTAHAKAKGVARKQQVNDLPPSVRLRRKPARDTAFNAVPVFYRSVFLVYHLAATAFQSDGKRIQRL